MVHIIFGAIIYVLSAGTMYTVHNAAIDMHNIISIVSIGVNETVENDD